MRGAGEPRIRMKVGMDEIRMFPGPFLFISATVGSSRR